MPIARDLFNRLLLPLVLHRCAASDYAQMLGRALSETGDHLIGQTIAQVVLARVSAQVFEGHDQDRYSADGPLSRHVTRHSIESGYRYIGTSLDPRDGGNETVATAGNRLHEPGVS